MLAIKNFMLRVHVKLLSQLLENSIALIILTWHAPVFCEVKSPYA